MSSHRTTANETAAAVFADATVDEMQTFFVSTFVHVGRYTTSEARDMRHWVVAAMVAHQGVPATAQFVADCGPEAVAAMNT